MLNRGLGPVRREGRCESRPLPRRMDKERTGNGQNSGLKDESESVEMAMESAVAANQNRTREARQGMATRRA